MKHICFILIITLITACGETKKNDSNQTDEAEKTNLISNNIDFYKIDLETYTESQSINAASKRIELLKKMGIEAVIINPLKTIGKGNTNESFELSSHDTKEELTKYIDKCHNLDLKVILQWPEKEMINSKSLSNQIESLLKIFKFDGIEFDKKTKIDATGSEQLNQLANAKKLFIIVNEKNSSRNLFTYSNIQTETTNNTNFSEYLKSVIQLAVKTPSSQKVINTTSITHFDSLFQQNEQAYLLHSAIVFTLPGYAMMKAGDENGFDKYLVLNGQKWIDWAELKYQNFYNELNKAKSEYPTLSGGTSNINMKVIETTDDNVIGFIRSIDKKHVSLTLSNPSDKKVKFRIKSIPVGYYKNIFSPEEFLYDETIHIELSPWQSKVFLKVKHTINKDQ
ncbi:alpha-amylase family protein [Aureibacter tunicatorum]|uniref:Uncharacterized protein n=1 Tax=Aureibacter tunicatorum TaxID=866807 RepID=A0AAE3XPA1_9BACT|nr:alpha-amylase family protein [Aureibacter tunicatorum]MDR6239618.1 hypothetical protein [Aureibacter tunicatorum]BDD04095.1 hypothetical protein AUTU_15780 [Aureibacter tunicatorum]